MTYSVPSLLLNIKTKATFLGTALQGFSGAISSRLDAAARWQALRPRLCGQFGALICDRRRWQRGPVPLHTLWLPYPLPPQFIYL